MEGAAWFALFSTVFLACQSRGQGKVYFSFQINEYSLTPRLQICEEFFSCVYDFSFSPHAIECHLWGIDCSVNLNNFVTVPSGKISLKFSLVQGVI